MDENELIDEIGEQLDESELAIILPVNKNDDETITCLICGSGKCEFSFMTIGPTFRSWHGIHEKCAEPYLAHRGMLETGEKN